MSYTATYSPEDNKLRLYALSRLDKDTYQRVRDAGFIWAPKQELFVAPMWTPARADFLAEMAGEIGDEDTSLVERAEQRADRFGVYSYKRAGDAERARKGVSAIADHIPFGQPILVGHHSERRARKDAQRIENGMRKAVSMWDTSEYWKSRAKGAIRAAKYKERADVRARRIKGLEADKRKHERESKEAAGKLALWRECAAMTDAEQQRAMALQAAAVCWLHLPRKEGDRQDWSHTPTAYDALTGAHPTLYAPRTLAEVFAAAERSYPASIAHHARWIEHLTNRIEYERAMLDEQGAGELLEKKKRPAQLPLCNYMVADGLLIPNLYQRSELVHYPQVVMTAAEYAAINKDYKGTRVVGNSHRVRVAMLRREGDRHQTLYCVFLNDSKTHEPPAAVDTSTPAPLPRPVYQAPEKSEQAQQFDALRDTLRAGVQVVVAPQLFTTRPDIAARAADLLGVELGQWVLDPSAGTGKLLQALPGVLPFLGRDRQTWAKVAAVEINADLAQGLRLSGLATAVYCADFMTWEPEGGQLFDRVIMNPPFADACDIKHILRALGMVKPGGRLVAICADGPRQRDALKPIADHWEELPADAFAHAGTNVRAALLVINK